jgi:hypothetical protein
MPDLRPAWAELAEYYDVCTGTLFGVPIEHVTLDEWRCLAGFFAARAREERREQGRPDR